MSDIGTREGRASEIGGIDCSGKRDLNERKISEMAGDGTVGGPNEKSGTVEEVVVTSSTEDGWVGTLDRVVPVTVAVGKEWPTISEAALEEVAEGIIVNVLVLATLLSDTLSLHVFDMVVVRST